MKHSLFIIYLMLCVGCLCINGSGKILEHNFIDFCILVYFVNRNENEIYANWKVKIVKNINYSSPYSPCSNLEALRSIFCFSWKKVHSSTSSLVLFGIYSPHNILSYSRLRELQEKSRNQIDVVIASILHKTLTDFGYCWALKIILFCLKLFQTV